jgi:uncharacterized membrane protein YfcA
MLHEILFYALLSLSALGAGLVNAVAGGGTLLTFPSLLLAMSAAGLADASVIANATSTVALVPGSLAGAWGYRRELDGTTPWLRLLFLPSLVGGVVGSLLLIVLDPKYFQLVVPWLLLLASVLFLIQPTLNRRLKTSGDGSLPSARMCAVLVGFQFFVSVYGGYFGAGIGILMLSSLGLTSLGDIHRMNAVKSVLAAVINGVSVLIFVGSGKVAWRYAPVMALASIAGGFLGAHFGRRLPRPVIRWTVILIGFGLAVYYFVRQAGA